MELLIGAHDPEGRMSDHIAYLKPTLELFNQTLICASPVTAVDTIRGIAELGLEVIPGSLQPHATKLVLLKRSKADVFSTELDKILHLQRFFPDELEAISRVGPEGFVLPCRAESAFQTCPFSWQEYETAANKEMEGLLGIPGVDVCVGDFIADRAVVNYLKTRPVLPNWECLVEMPADVVLAGYPLRYVALEGLEWEDPDRYQLEIQKEGFKNWKNRMYESALEQEKRRKELDGYLRAIIRFRERLALQTIQVNPSPDRLI